ncbi:MAG: hypothetical protein P3X22_004650 [Thermoprotei archaeon]|nr:hypothetical protein [Thermoprotei archaeon]
MNPRIIASALVLALFILPLVAPFTTVIPASAQQTPLNVTSKVVTPGGELGFILNRTVLIAGHPVQGAPVLYAWISKNPETVLVKDEFLVATLEVGTAATVIFGTLLVSDDISGWLGAPAGKVYLKITSATQAGAVAVVSDPFWLVVDPAIIEKALQVLDNKTKRPVTEFAYYEYFGRSNTVRILLNLTSLEAVTGPNLGRLDNILTFNVILTYKTDMLYVKVVKAAPWNIHTNFLSNTKYVTVAGGKVANLTGRIGNFTLNFPEITKEVAPGYRAAYEPFKLNVLVANGTKTLNGTLVKANEVKGSVINYTFNFTVLSIGWTKTFNIYPTVTYIYSNVGGDAEIEVGDSVYLEFRNFKDGTYTLIIRFLAMLPDGSFTPPLPVPIKTTVSITDGYGTKTEAIRDNPYGGRLILTTVNVTKAGDLALAKYPRDPYDRIWPRIDFMSGFTLYGGLEGNSTARFVPGEFIFIRGRGFLVETPTITLINVTNGVEIPVSRIAFTGVYANGSFGAIIQIDPTATLYNDNLVQLRVYTGVFDTTFNKDWKTGEVTLGYVRVFIEPRPERTVITRILPVPDAEIQLGATRYPYNATWLPEGQRTFTVLAYGIPATYLKFDVTMRTRPYVFTLGLNIERTGVGSLLKTFKVPEAPYAFYWIRVASGTAYWDSLDNLQVGATAAALDPEEKVYKVSLFLPAPMNLTITGYGFIPNEYVWVDIPQLGLYNIPLPSGPAIAPVQAETNVRGTFEGWLDLAMYITAPGTYTLSLWAGVEAEITISILVPPPFTVKVTVNAAQFGDLPSEVWVVAFYGGSVAASGQVVSVSVAVYLRVGDETRIFTLTPVVAVPGQAIFYASFTPPGEALGKNLLVVATAQGRYSSIAPTDTASDIASFTVPPVTFADIVKAIAAGAAMMDEALAALNNIDAKLGALTTLVNSGFGNVMSGIAAVRSDIADVRALIVTVDSKVGDVLTALVAISDQNSAILNKLSELEATVSGGVASIRTDIMGLSELLKAANLSIAKIVVDEGCRVRAAIADSEGRIRAVVEGSAKAITDLVTATRGDIAKVSASVGALSDALAAFRTDTAGRLDSISAAVGGVGAELGKLRTDLTAAATVLVDIRTGVEAVKNDLRALGDTAKTIQGTVNSINAAVPDLARKGDVSGAQTTITGAISSAQASIEGKIAGAQDAATTSSRNWGIINAILIIIAIAVLAYQFFVRKP